MLLFDRLKTFLDFHEMATFQIERMLKKEFPQLNDKTKIVSCNDIVRYEFFFEPPKIKHIQTVQGGAIREDRDGNIYREPIKIIRDVPKLDNMFNQEIKLKYYGGYYGNSYFKLCCGYSPMTDTIYFKK